MDCSNGFEGAELLFIVARLGQFALHPNCLFYEKGKLNLNSKLRWKVCGWMD